MNVEHGAVVLSVTLLLFGESYHGGITLLYFRDFVFRKIGKFLAVFLKILLKNTIDLLKLSAIS